MSEEMISVPKQVLVKVAENNKIILEKLERISERLKNRKAIFSFFAGVA